jgi:hypothetical protein
MVRVLRHTLPAVVVAFGVALTAQQSPPPQTPAPELTLQQKLEFLQTAEVVASKEIGKGVTRPYRLTLTSGTVTHDAAFQAIDEQKWHEVEMEGGKTERNFRDYWGFNIAAFKLAQLMGLPELVPASVERTWNGKKGALVWWVKAQFDEEGRRKKNAMPPNITDWNRQVRLMQLFTELTADTDRNMGNVLITDDWRVVLIDFTRAFRLRSALKSPEKLAPCDPGTVARLKVLTREAVQDGLSPYAGPDEVKTLLDRRDLIVGRCSAAATSK